MTTIHPLAPRQIEILPVAEATAESAPTAPQTSPTTDWRRFAGTERAATAGRSDARPLTFNALGPPALESDVTVPMALTGLAPLAEHWVTLARPDRWDPKSVLTRRVKLTSDVHGEILFGEADVRSLPGLKKRRLSSEEKAAASIIGAKLGERVPLEELARAQPELGALIEADPGKNTVRFVAEALESGARHGFEQAFIAPEGVRIIESDRGADRFVGSIYLPPGAPEDWGQPIAIWGGSSGFINADRAQELVSQGRPVLALKYFSYDASEEPVRAGVLTAPLRRVPLEYFADAIDRFLDRADIGRSKGISILGESRGGEAALLLAQHFEGRLPITDVIAMRPLHFVVGSKINGPDAPEEIEVSSWTLRGEDLPFAALPPDKKQFSWARELSDGKTADHQGEQLAVVDLVRGFRAIEPTAPKEAFIDLSRSSANVHLIGGDDDRMWPSADAVRALAFQRPGHAVVVKGAGHYSEPGRRSTAVPEEIAYPVTPLPTGPKSDIGAFAIDGGTPLRNAVLDVAYGRFMQAAAGEQPAPLFPELIQFLQPKGTDR